MDKTMASNKDKTKGAVLLNKKIDTLLIDLNGTLYQRGIPVEGAIETVNRLRQLGYNLNFVTNTDGRCIHDVHQRVCQMGFDIYEHEVLTPVSAVKRFIQTNGENTYYTLVHNDVDKDLLAARRDETAPDYVVIGDFSSKMTYDEINKVFRMIQNGSEILALSKTLWYKDTDGNSINTGAFVKMFEAACDKKAILLGKPSTDFLGMGLARTNSEPQKTLVIGDDILTDIQGGHKLGAKTALVKTGVYSTDALNKASVQPDYILKSIADVFDIL